MNNKKLGTVVGGIALIAVAAYIFITGNDATYRYLGGAVMTLLGAAVLYSGLRNPSQGA